MKKRGRTLFWFLLYNTVLLLFSSILLPFLLPLTALRKGWRFRLSERLGLYSWRKNGRREGEKRVWIHASSAGETGCALLLIKGLLGRRGEGEAPSIYLSTSTPAGYGAARRGADGMAGVPLHYFMAPLDLPFSVRRTFCRVAPSLLILVEAELWPNLIMEAEARGVPVVVVNGRVSVRGLVRFRLIRPLIRHLSGGIRMVLAQSRRDAGRFVEIGIPEEKVEVSGNIKTSCIIFEGGGGGLLFTEPLKETLLDAPILVAGSTHRGEEEILMCWIEPLIREGRLKLILAPRHVKRGGEVRRVVERFGFTPLLRSASDLEVLGSPDWKVFIVDTLGELLEFYGISTLSFVGGTLNGLGGHNIMEPVAKGKIVCYGPDIDNFEDVAEVFEKCGAGYRVREGGELRALFLDILSRRREYEEYAREGFREMQRLSSIARGVIDRVNEMLA